MNPNFISSAHVKDNRLVIKNLNENDLDNFECISEHGYLTLHKQLRLDKTEFTTFNPKYTINSQKNMIISKSSLKTYKNLFEMNTIQLTDLNIHSVYLQQSNDLKLTCETSSG